MEAETLILSPYSLEQHTSGELAKYLADVLSCTIEYDGGIISGEKRTGILHNESKGTISEYVLKLGESTLSFFNHFIMISSPPNEDYDSMETNYNDNDFADSAYLLEVFVELRRLGVEEVYFIDKNPIVQKQIKAQTTWDHIIEKLIESGSFFRVDLFR